MPQEPNAFISWSGDRSKLIAAKLREWLPQVVQAAIPWMSEEDIEKGSRSLSEITKALGSASVGIVCLTTENLSSPWLLFEAGTLSKAVGDSARVCTYLLDDLNPGDVKPPLGMFQASRATKEDTRRLVRTVATSVGNQLQGDALDDLVDAMWPHLEKTIRLSAQVGTTKIAKRGIDDMVAEILEIVRGSYSGQRVQAPSPTAALPLVGISPNQVRQIMDVIKENQKFLGELVEHASSWSLNGSVLTLVFPKAKRPFAEMVEGKESSSKIKAAAFAVLGIPVSVATSVTDK